MMEYETTELFDEAYDAVPEEDHEVVDASLQLILSSPASAEARRHLVTTEKGERAWVVVARGRQHWGIYWWLKETTIQLLLLKPL